MKFKHQPNKPFSEMTSSEIAEWHIAEAHMWDGEYIANNMPPKWEFKETIEMTSCRAEITQLDDMISNLPPSSIIDLISLQARRESVKEELKELKKNNIYKEVDCDPLSDNAKTIHQEGIGVDDLYYDDLEPPAGDPWELCSVEAYNRIKDSYNRVWAAWDWTKFENPHEWEENLHALEDGSKIKIDSQPSWEYDVVGSIEYIQPSLGSTNRPPDMIARINIPSKKLLK